MNASLDDARRFFSLLAQPGDVFELRALARVNGQQHTTSGYFDDVDALARAAVAASGKHDGVYVTINPVEPSLLFRAPKNSIQRAGSGSTTSDRDVRVRRSMLIDVDPVRPAGISSSNAEHDAAIDLAKRIRDDLSKKGWPAPILADSGNGAHLIYAVDLPVDDGGLIQRVLAALSRSWSTGALKVDEKVFNAARISKIYGTLTRKGVNAPERPHRLARIIDAPAELFAVPLDMLEWLGRKEQRTNTGGAENRDGSPRFDIERWIGEHLPDAKERDWPSGRKWLLKECPFNPQHDRGEAFITEQHSGVIAAGCQHESCFKTWHELRDRFEPGYRERREGRREQHRRNGAQSPPASAQPTPSANDNKSARWRVASDLVDEIWSRKDEPWVQLRATSEEEVVRMRLGGIAVVIGGSGSGKSSLVSNMLIRHALEVGPAIALSIELPADELAARIVGIRCDASWEDALTGRVRREFMQDALDLPLYVLDRKNATIANLHSCADWVAETHPGKPILVAVDYAQLIHSREREVRLRVADAFEQLDDVARAKRMAMIAVSQMGRAGARAARMGEAIGADAADLGAESAAIERFATVTLTIGQKGEPCDDGSQSVELSVGKARMGSGDRVLPMRYWGRSGIWRVDGDSKTASEVRDERDTEKAAEKKLEIRTMLVGAAHRSTEPLSRESLTEKIKRGSKKEKYAAIKELLASGELVEVARYAPRSRVWMVWTPDRVRSTPGLQTVQAMHQSQESDDE